MSTLEKIVAKISHANAIIHLGGHDSKLLVKMLLNPPEPNKHLKKAVKRYKRVINVASN